MKTSTSLLTLAFALILAFSTLSAQETPQNDSTKNIPAADEFVPVEVDPSFDMEELVARLKYPEEARKNNIEGKVIVMVYISKEGKPVKTRITQSDNPLLEEAAINAIMQTTFTPAIQRGKPVGVWLAIPITFALN
jgi:protein TonB